MLPEFPIRVAALPKRLVVTRELESFEGPILSELRAESGALYLEKWCAREHSVERTLIVRSERRAIAEYLAGRLSMLDLLTIPNDGVGFIVDSDSGWVRSVYVVPIASLPGKYLPDKSAKHDVSLRPEWDTHQQNFLLGKKWDAKLLASIERRYLDVYGFSFLTEPRRSRAMPAGVLRFVFDGGFPLMHAFNHIRAAVPQESRAKSVGVSAHSPGILTLDAPGGPVSHLMKVLAAVPEAASAYSAVHQWSRLPWQKVSKVPGTAMDDLKRLAARLLVDIGVLISPDKPGEEALLVAGKLLASYYRRLWGLLDFGDEVEFLDAASIPRQADSDNFYIEDEDDQLG